MILTLPECSAHVAAATELWLSIQTYIRGLVLLIYIYIVVVVVHHSLFLFSRNNLINWRLVAG